MDNNGDIRQKIIQELHASGTGGNLGRKTTLHRVQQLFYWPNL